MHTEKSTAKTMRVLALFYRLLKGERVRKRTFANDHKVTERSIERDLQHIRNLLSEECVGSEVLFDKIADTYYLNGNSSHRLMSMEEVLLLAEILISSRCLRKDEMKGMFNALSEIVNHNERKYVREILNRTLKEYVSPPHEKAILKMFGDLITVIENHQEIKLFYTSIDSAEIEEVCIVQPLAVKFLEYHFYLIAYRKENKNVVPELFRLDRIHCFERREKVFEKEAHTICQVNEMKKRIQFVCVGDLLQIKIRCAEDALESVQDRFPNVEIIEKGENNFILLIEILGDGIIQWLLTQIDKVELIEPKQLRKYLEQEGLKITNIYQKEDFKINGEFQNRI